MIGHVWVNARIDYADFSRVIEVRALVDTRGYFDGYTAVTPPASGLAK